MTTGNGHGGARENSGGARAGAGRKMGGSVAHDRTVEGMEAGAASMARYWREGKLRRCEPGATEPPAEGEACWFWVDGAPVSWGSWVGNTFVRTTAPRPEVPEEYREAHEAYHARKQAKWVAYWSGIRELEERIEARHAAERAGESESDA